MSRLAPAFGPLRVAFYVAVGCLIVAPFSPAAEPQVCLDGLDPVALAAGEETPGNEELSVEHGRYRYRFASEEHKAAFEADPARYGVQFGGACARMGPLSGLCNTTLYAVHDGRIYLFASEQCRAGFLAAPERHIDRPEAALEGTEEQLRRGAELVALALRGFGGVEAVDGLTTYEKRVVKMYQAGGQEHEYSVARLAAFPDRFRYAEEWEGGGAANVVAGEAAFRAGGEAPLTMDDFERHYFLADFHRDPLVLLKARSREDFQAVAAGTEEEHGRTVELLRVRLYDANATWAIDPETGRILSARYHGRPGAGAIGDIVRRFADFRDAGGLTLPHSATLEFDGQAVPSGTVTYSSIGVNEEVDPALFTAE